MNMILAPGADLIMSDEELFDELERCDYRLQMAVAICVAMAEEIGYRIIWSSFERTFEQTQEIYRRSHLPVPQRPGVHDVRPCRGADGSLEPILGDETAESEGAAGGVIAARVNGLVIYPRGFSTVVFHSVQGGKHLHVQVPWDNLILAPPALGRVA